MKCEPLKTGAEGTDKQSMQYESTSRNQVANQLNGAIKPRTQDEMFVCNSVLQTKVSSCVRPRICFKRLLEFHETVSSNRTLLNFLKLVSYFSRQLADHNSAISDGHFTVIPADVYTQFKCLQIHYKKMFQTLLVLISKYGEPHIHFFDVSLFLSSKFLLFAVHLNVALQVTQWDNNFVLLSKHHVD